MSHFVVAVLVERRDFVKEDVCRLLAPYDENLKVEEYGRKCSCVGRHARMSARAFAEKSDPACKGCNGAGVYQTTYNPQSKWDRYSIGGRWSGRYGKENVVGVKKLLKDRNSDNVSFAVVTPDGKWHERGKMGWFACVSDEMDKDDWVDTFWKLLESHKNCYVVGVDCHI